MGGAVSGIEPSAGAGLLQRVLLGWLDELKAPGGDRAARNALCWFMRELDLAVVACGEPTGFAVQTLTRAIAAAGRVLIAEEGFGEDHPVLRTVAAADHYTRWPSQSTYDAYVVAATSSYPYGAGEGCFRIDEAGSCEPGTGCISGAGSLEQVAIVAGASAVLTALETELAPWLRDTAIAAQLDL